MPLIRERGIFLLAVRVLDSIRSGVLSSHLLTAYETLSLLVETEDFSTYKAEYIPTAEDGRLLMGFKARCLDQYKTDMEKRKLVRPLMDIIDRTARQYRLK